jgi:hypothetical protein
MWFREGLENHGLLSSEWLRVMQGPCRLFWLYQLFWPSFARELANIKIQKTGAQAGFYAVSPARF